MDGMQQPVRFAASYDGVRLAYTVCGRGHPLVRVLAWISHVEHDCETADTFDSGPGDREI